MLNLQNKFKNIFSIILGFPRSLDGKESACNAGDPSSISESRRLSGEGNVNALQYSLAWRIQLTE